MSNNKKTWGKFIFMIILLIAFIATQTTAQQRLPSPEFEPCEPHNPPIYTDSIYQGGAVVNSPKINLKPPKAVLTQGEGEKRLDPDVSTRKSLDDDKGLVYALVTALIAVVGWLIKDILDRSRDTATAMASMRDTATVMTSVKDTLVGMASVQNQYSEVVKELIIIAKGTSKEVTIALEKLANLQRNFDDLKGEVGEVKNKVAHI